MNLKYYYDKNNNSSYYLENFDNYIIENKNGNKCIIQKKKKNL